MENTHKNAPYPQKKDSFSGNASSKKQNDNKNEADFAPFYPIPQHTAALLNSSPQANFSLCFPRLVQWIKSGNSIKKTETDTNQKIPGSIEQLCYIANEKMSYAQAVLDRYHEQQKAYIELLKKRKLQTLTLYAQLSAPFITGLGSGHPTETGMVLDRNTGVPYLPASSIKGVLRLAYAVSIAKGRSEVPESELERYFGSSDSTEGRRGQVVFLDAYPLKVPQVKVDIMNPHFQPYYAENNAENNATSQSSGPAKEPIPLETNAPVPIKFLSVNDTNTIFVFRVFFLPLAEKKKTLNENVSGEGTACTLPFTAEDKKALYNAFDIAFTVIGFGGKTAIGYGRFNKRTKDVAEKMCSASTAAPSKTTTSVSLHTVNQSGIAATAQNTPKNSALYKAKLIEQNKKGTWKAELCDFPDYVGAITDSVAKIPNGVIGGFVMVKVTAAKQGNSIFSYAGEVPAST
jgi:hypothetical protein